MFCKKGVLKKFAKYTGKRLYQSLFSDKVAYFLKKETLAQAFSCEFCEIFKNCFFIEHLWWLLLPIVFQLSFAPLSLSHFSFSVEHLDTWSKTCARYLLMTCLSQLLKLHLHDNSIKHLSLCCNGGFMYIFN